MLTLMPVWDSSGESRLKFCAEALNHVRKIPRKQKQGSVTITVSSTIVSSTDRATWTIDGYDLVDVAQRAFKALSALPELKVKP